MPENEALIRLRVLNETRAAFQQFEADARKATSGATASFKTFEKELQTTGVALLGMGAVGGALITKTTLLAARVQTLGAVMENIGRVGGYTAEQMRAFEEAVKKQGITTQVARTALIRMTQANIDLANSTKLARIAQDAAVIAGINSSEALERMIHGVTTLNPLILKHMGIIVNLEQGYSEFAKANGKTADSLTGLEKQQIAVNQVIQAGTRIIGSYESAMSTAGKKMTSLARFTEEAQVAIGETFLPAFASLIDALTAGLKWFNALSESQKQWISWTLAAGTATATLGGSLLILLSKMPALVAGLSATGAKLLDLAAFSKSFGTAAGFLTTKLALANNAVVALGTAGVVAAAVVAVTVALGKLAQTVTDVKEKTAALNDQMAAHMEQVAIAAPTYAEYRAEAERLAQEFNKAGIFGRRYVATQEEINASVQRGRASARTLGEAMIVLSETAYENTRAWEAQKGAIAANVARWREMGNALQTEIVQSAEGAQKALEDLDFVLGIDLTKAYKDHDEAMTGHQDTMQDAQSQIEKLQAAYTNVAAMPTSVKKRLQELTSELTKSREATGRASNEITVHRAALGNAEDALARLTTKYGEFGAMPAAVQQQYLGLNAQVERHGAALREATASVEDHRQKITEAEAAILAIRAQYSDWSKMPPEVRAQIEELNGTINGSKTAIAEEEEAWRRNTAEILFNMAQRAMSALPVEQQAAAMGVLAEKLGILDPAAAAAFAKIGELTQQFADEKLTVQEYAAQVDALRSALLGLPAQVTSSVVVNVEQRGQVAVRVPGGGVAYTAPGQVAREQHGGRLAPFALTGEAGPEMLVSTDDGIVVIPAEQTRKLLRLGVRPTTRMQRGGFMTDGGGRATRARRGKSTPTRTTMTGAARRAAGTTSGREMPLMSGAEMAATGAGGGQVVSAVESAQAVAIAAAAAAQAAVPAAQQIARSAQQQQATGSQQIAAQVSGTNAVVERLDAIHAALLRQGTADETARMVTEGLAKLDLG